ncbi:hypothetical protein DY000_02028417 [Brassica cretica]|uniref:Uncharacterized protein n=1 Tax=Brassica cretica TaxID=69181 RepID=A0ABQ7DFX9_BRACR|nr:hypothetical protein DY000_02028417 [Brassica cretica]
MPSRRLNTSKLLEDGEYFQNKLVDTIHFMDILNLKDSVEKDTFFRKLPNVAEQLPREIVPYLKAHVVPFFLLTWTNCKSSRLIFLNSEVRSKAFQAVEQFLEILKQNYEKTNYGETGGTGGGSAIPETAGLIGSSAPLASYSSSAPSLASAASNATSTGKTVQSTDDEDPWAAIAAPPPTSREKPLSSGRGRVAKPAAPRLGAQRINRTSSGM